MSHMNSVSAYLLAIGIAFASNVDAQSAVATLPGIAKALGEAKDQASIEVVVTQGLSLRDDFAYDLEEVLKSSLSKEAKLGACVLLGYFRMEKGVQSVARNFRLEGAEEGEEHRVPLWRRYPCLDALAHIGREAVGELIALLTKLENADMRIAILKALNAIEGRDTESVLERAISEAEPKEATQLREALRAWQKERPASGQP